MWHLVKHTSGSMLSLIHISAHDFGKGRAVYISGVPYSFANSRTLYRAIL